MTNTPPARPTGDFIRRDPQGPVEAAAAVPICGAKRTNGEGVCKNKAGQGTPHYGFGRCKHHGGNTESGIRAGAKHVGRQIIANMKFGGDRNDYPDITPEQALLEEVRRSYAMVRWLEDRIGQWEWLADNGDIKDHPEIGGLPLLLTETTRGYSQETDQHQWLVLYREERAHAARMAKLAIDAGIAERMVRLAEDQGSLLANAVKQILEALSLNPRQAKLVPQVVPPILRSLSTGRTIQGEIA